MTLTETVLLSFLSWTLGKFLFPGIFLQIVFFKLSRNLEDIYSWNYNTIVRIMVLWYITVVCSVYKTWSITNETPAEHLPLQKQPFADVYKKGFLKNFLKLTGKQLYRILYLKNLQATSLQLYFKRDGCFLLSFTRFARAPFP